MLLEFTIFIEKFKTAINITNSKKFAWPFNMRDPIMVNGEGIEFHEFRGLIGIDVPFIHDIIVADAE